MFDLFKFLKRKESTTGSRISERNVSSGEALKVEEIDFTKTVTERYKSVQKPVRHRKVPVDERKKFIEVVLYLRDVAGLSPLEEVRKEKTDEVPKPETNVQTTVMQEKQVKQQWEVTTTEAVQEKPAEQVKPVSIPESPAGKESNIVVEKAVTPHQRAPRESSKSLSESEINKIVKVSLKHLENEMMKLLEDSLSKRGVAGFKERAMARKKIRKFITENADRLAEEFVNALKKGTDPRREEFYVPLAKELFAQIYSGTEEQFQPKKDEADRTPSKVVNEDNNVKEEKITGVEDRVSGRKEKKVDTEKDLLELLEEDESEKNDKDDADDLLKILGGQ